MNYVFICLSICFASFCFLFGVAILVYSTNCDDLTHQVFKSILGYLKEIESLTSNDEILILTRAAKKEIEILGDMK